MHVAGRPAPPGGDGEYESVPVSLTEVGFRGAGFAADDQVAVAAAALAAEFERPASGRAESISRGLYAHSHFYRAHGDFHLFNTCNTWTARMLETGGVALSPTGIVTAGKLMARLREALAAQ